MLLVLEPFPSTGEQREKVSSGSLGGVTFSKSKAQVILQAQKEVGFPREKCFWLRCLLQGTPTMNQTTKNIPATLDLNKSLLDFEAVIAKALSLNNVTEWDGRTIKQQSCRNQESSTSVGWTMCCLTILQSFSVRVGAKNSH